MNLAINFFGMPSPIMALAFEESMLIALKTDSVDTNMDNLTEMKRLTIPANTLKNVGDTLLVRFVGEGNGNALHSQIDIVGALQTGQSGAIWAHDDGFGDVRIQILDLYLVLIGTGVVKGTVVKNMDMGSLENFIVQVGMLLDNPFDLVLSQVSGFPGDVFTSILGVARVLSNPAGEPNIGTPENMAFDGDLSWEWNGTPQYPDPNTWGIQAQRSDNGAWINVDSTAGSDRSKSIDGAALAEGDNPDLGDFWNGKLRIVGTDAGGIAVTNISPEVNTGLV